MATIRTTPEELAHALQRVALGDRQAFKTLYGATADKLYSVSLHILRRADWAEEALQDTFIKVWHGAGDYSSNRGSVMSWLISMIRYRSIDMLRNKNNQSVNVDDLPELQTHTELDQAVANSEYAQQLENCLQELQPDSRQSIQLAFLYGLSHKEVSDHLSTALGTVKSWIRRGLDSLKRCLSK
ncbi:sigma-70 family RNA polymerase sigma factor [Pseudidiomarina sp. CB1]|uniref:sigma-70 family RNA polymerase sigma factor n=1 Tax=Pseudidiomarina sp. CB1 TaxID=2972484 RepID=UPI002163AA65|nr:sigma-70 family RNA polymerase sigma factor [Pseudidiomarina sp. CB1]